MYKHKSANTVYMYIYSKNTVVYIQHKKHPDSENKLME